MKILSRLITNTLRLEHCCLDSYDKNLYGGSGVAFDWSMIPESLRSKVIVAGGLNADNVVSMLERC